MLALFIFGRGKKNPHTVYKNALFWVCTIAYDVSSLIGTAGTIRLMSAGSPDNLFLLFVLWIKHTPLICPKIVIPIIYVVSFPKQSDVPFPASVIGPPVCPSLFALSFFRVQTSLWRREVVAFPSRN